MHIRKRKPVDEVRRAQLIRERDEAIARSRRERAA